MMTPAELDDPVKARNSAPREGPWLWLGPLLLMAAIGTYALARYGGTWAEADSTTFTNVIRPIVQTGRLLSAEAGGAVYPNGFGYQAISSIIVTATGLDVLRLQQLVFPLLGFIVVLPAWLLYRELLGNDRGATIATMLLLAQPEFLFVILRSSHEKFTRTFMLLALFLLVRSFKLSQRPRQLTTHIVLFYVLVFALIASNSFLAHSFIFAVAVALALGMVVFLVLPYLRSQDPTILKRLMCFVLIGLALAYVFNFYLYSPALYQMIVLRDTWDRLAALIFEVDARAGPKPANAYAYVSTSWISLYAYFMVSIGNWILLFGSFAVWVVQGVRWVLRRAKPASDMIWLLWLLYISFAAQGALSIVVDASGALGSNLQHRLFPSFAPFAVAVLGGALAQWRPKRFAGALQTGLMLALMCVALLSMFKATNEPLLSNKWTFYRPSELQALRWADEHQRNAEIWTEFDERMSVAYLNANGYSTNGNDMTFLARPSARTLLVSSVTRLRGERLRRPVPVPSDALRVYDNGEAEVYRLRPQSPYQQ